MSHYSSERVVISQSKGGGSSHIVINETEGSGSLVNVTTTSKTLSRPSSYRKSYGIETGVDLKGVRLGERQQLTKLNHSLGGYIEKVHELEALVKKLTSENNKLRKKCKKGIIEVDISAIYSDDLRNLRTKLVQLKAKNVELQVDRDNKAFDIEETLHKLGSIESKILVYKKEIEDLKKDLDDVSIDKTRLLAKISTLESQIKLEAGLHETELANLRAQLSVESKLVFETDVDKPSMLPDLTSIIANVRKEYEAFNAKNLSHLDNYYKEKVHNLTTQLRTLQSKVKNVKEDNALKQRKLAKIEIELGPLKQKRLALEKHIENLETRMVSMGKDQQHEIDNLRIRISRSKTELNKYLTKYQELNAIKLNLDKEISIYKKLIIGEKTRILSYRRRSHSSSSSSSDDFSSSSSDSQTSSDTDTESEFDIGWLESDGKESSDSDVSTDDDICSRSEDEGESCDDKESGISYQEQQLRIERKTKRSEKRKQLAETRKTESSEQKTIRVERRTSRRKRRKELRKLRKEETTSERKERIQLEECYKEELKATKEMFAKESEEEKLQRLKKIQDFKKIVKDFVAKDKAEKAARKIEREERKKKNAESRAKRREERQQRKEARTQRRSQVTNIHESTQEQITKKVEKKQRKKEKKNRKIEKEQRGIERVVRKVEAENRKCGRRPYRCNTRYRGGGGCYRRCTPRYRPRCARRVCGCGVRVPRNNCVNNSCGLCLGLGNMFASLVGGGGRGNQSGGRGNQSGGSGGSSTQTTNNVNTTTTNNTNNTQNVHNNTVYNYHYPPCHNNTNVSGGGSSSNTYGGGSSSNTYGGGSGAGGSKVGGQQQQEW